MRSTGFDFIVAGRPAAQLTSHEPHPQESLRVTVRDDTTVSNWTLACECLHLERFQAEDKAA